MEFIAGFFLGGCLGCGAAAIATAATYCSLIVYHLVDGV